jgi:pimeloyl-ACP methyl ester carboxylesterase
MRRSTSVLLAIPLLVGLSTIFFPTAAAAESEVAPWSGATDRSPSGANCNDYLFDVSFAPGSSANSKIFGRLCSRGSATRKTIEVLSHGGSYDHTYWDFPYQPDTYSYVEAATKAGFTTLDLDRLGYGYSSHTLPELSGFATQAWVIHQVIQKVRSGALGIPVYKVVLVGHSMGSFVAWNEAGMYHDVDGVIISGAEHHIAPAALGAVSASLEPAQVDPVLGNKQLPLGYTTTFPGTRCDTFYYTPNADPAVCALDENLKSTDSAAELLNVPTAITDGAPSNAITAPVLMADGQFDLFFCDSDCAAPGDTGSKEAAFYSSSPCYQQYFLPDAGHDINLQRNAPLWFETSNAWVTARIGTSAAQPATEPCG